MKTSTNHPISINPRRTIGGIEPHIVISEEHADSLEITDFPVESGASINDHAFKKPETVTIEAATSASPRKKEEESANLNELYGKLLQLQENREPFDIITGKRMYSDMLIENLSVKTDATKENVLWFSASCKKIRIVGLQTTSLPPNDKQKFPSKTGNPVDRGNVTPNKSAAKTFGDWVKSLF